MKRGITKEDLIDTTAAWLYTDDNYAYYYTETKYGDRVDFKIPKFEAEMVYPGIPSELLIKYIN